MSGHDEQVQSLKWFYVVLGCNGAFVVCTFGGALFPLYLSDLGLSSDRIGLVIGAIPFMQVLALVGTPMIERLGYRRAYLIFHGSRKLTLMALIPAPWILQTFGGDILLVFVSLCVLIFGIQRSLGETAFFPWIKEAIPDEIRGGVQGTANLFGGLGAVVALVLAGLLVEHQREWGLGRFGGYQLAYLFFGFIGITGVLASQRMPGGYAVAPSRDRPRYGHRLRASLRDRRFLAFILGEGVLQGSIALIGTFLTLYGSAILAIPSGWLVSLNIGAWLGGALTSRFWGRAADHYGSRRVLIWTLSAMALMPLGWILLPNLPESARIAGLGAANLCFGGVYFGSRNAALRLMYNGIVPEEKKGEYLAIRYAAIGIVAGVIPAIAGFSIGLFEGFSFRIWGLSLNSFTPLFGATILVWAGIAWLFSRIGYERV